MEGLYSTFQGQKQAYRHGAKKRHFDRIYRIDRMVIGSLFPQPGRVERFAHRLFHCRGAKGNGKRAYPADQGACAWREMTRTVRLGRISVSVRATAPEASEDSLTLKILLP